MSTHRLKLHGGTSGHGSLARPARAIHRLERRWGRRTVGGGGDEGTAAPANDGGEVKSRRIVYWSGDERDTTQGDW